MRFPCGAGLADLDAEVDEAPDSRLDPEPASLALEPVEAKADNGKNDDAREYSQHNGTLQPLHRAPVRRTFLPTGCDPRSDPWIFVCGAVLCIGLSLSAVTAPAGVISCL